MSAEDYKSGKPVRMGRFFDHPKPWELDRAMLLIGRQMLVGHP